jgi:hypothetical protein
MENIARYLMFAGVALFLIGGGVYLAAKFGIPLGQLPGDIRIEGENGSFYLPGTQMQDFSCFLLTHAFP